MPLKNSDDGPADVLVNTSIGPGAGSPTPDSQATMCGVSYKRKSGEKESRPAGPSSGLSWAYDSPHHKVGVPKGMAGPT